MKGVRGILLSLVVAFVFLTMGWDLIQQAIAAPAACAVPGAYATIQAAVNDPACDIVNVATGTFTENVVITRTVTIQGAGKLATIVSGGQNGRVFEIPWQSGDDIEVTIADLHIQEGKFLAGDGGGIYNGETLYLNNVYLDNSAANNGGGLYNRLLATAVIDQSNVELNSAGSTGGNIRNAGVMTITNSIVSGAFLGEGIYNSGTLVVKTTTLEGNFSGGIESTTGFVLEDSLLRGNLDFGLSAAKLSGDPIEVWVSGSSIESSVANSSSGSGIALTGNVSLTLQVSALYSNAAAGIYAQPFNGAYPFITVTNSIIQENGDGGIYTLGQLLVDHSRIISNTRTGNGGGIYHASTDFRLEITASEISYNQASICGGGVYSSGSTSVFRLRISDTNISHNQAVDGGGLCVTNSRAQIRRSAFTYNQATGSGGGFYLGLGSILATTVRLSNATFSANRANGDGGGIYTRQGTLEATNLTIANNIADFDNNGGAGGGYYLDGIGTVIQLANSIVAQNTRAAGVSSDCMGTVASLGNNLIGNASGCTGFIGSDLTGTSVALLNPQLGPLAWNSGLTPSHAPLTGSPALDGGSQTICSQPPVEDLDQREFNRSGADGNQDGGLDGNPCDIGAIELYGTPPVGRLLFLPLVNR